MTNHELNKIAKEGRSGKTMSIFQKGENFGKELTKWAQHGFETCDSSKRISICNECDKYKMGICTVCGCMIHLKTKMLTASCPIGKW